MARSKGKGAQRRESLDPPGATGPTPPPGTDPADFHPSNPDGASTVDPEDVKRGRGKSARGDVKATRIRVVATRTGYYGHRRRKADEEFDMYVRDGGKLPSWVESVASREKIKAEGMSLDLEEEGYPGHVSVARPRVADRSNLQVEVV